MSQLLSRKPIAALLAESDAPGGLKRALGAGDLIMLGIGAVIGAGIFGAIGTAASGQYDAAGHLVRSGAGPALILSFLLLGVCCALAGLCYAELASMIPQGARGYETRQYRRARVTWQTTPRRGPQRSGPATRRARCSSDSCHPPSRA